MRTAICLTIIAAAVAAATLQTSRPAQTAAAARSTTVKTLKPKGIEALTLQPYNGGNFTMKKPAGWKIVTAGNCSTFAVLSKDPSAALRQVFYFTSIGPFYLSERQRSIDQAYMASGGYPVAWSEMPAVSPLGPAEFLRQFHLMAKSSVGKSFMPECPRLENVQVISAQDVDSPLPGRTQLVRAVFTQNGKAGQGLFLATVVEYVPEMNGPGSGIGWALQVIGVAAPLAEFSRLQSQLVSCVESLKLEAEWVQGCVRQSEQEWGQVIRAGQTLRETSEIITRGWEQRNRTDDILSQKRSDATLGLERLYDPSTGEVYQFRNGFSDGYLNDSGSYSNSHLKPLPDDPDIWRKAPLDGSKYVQPR